MTKLSILERTKLYFSRVKQANSKNPYVFGRYNDNCDIRFLNTFFARIERISLSNNTVNIGHFSVNEPYRGRGIGEACLRKFASRVKEIDTTIKCIQFTLYSAPTNANHQKIGNAREQLMIRIGATNISKTPVGKKNNMRVQVSGSWDIKDWKI